MRGIATVGGVKRQVAEIRKREIQPVQRFYTVFFGAGEVEDAPHLDESGSESERRAAGLGGDAAHGVRSRTLALQHQPH